MGRYTLAATATFGLESVVAGELAALGVPQTATENGRVVFEGGDQDIARLNLWLRAADRLLIRLAEFPAASLDDIYEGVRAVAWRDFLPPDARVVVTARSRAERGAAAGGSMRDRTAATPRSRQERSGARARPASGAVRRAGTIGVPSLQSVGKKAIVDVMSGGKGGRIEETGPLYPVEIAMAAGNASVTLDTSGSGLHKRGYRTEAGEAPLRETLAAGMVILSRWKPPRPFSDPLCGSGTIPIEAAMIALNIAPGLGRSFAAEQWPHIPKEVWQRAREQARSVRLPGAELEILASDRDEGVLAAAGRNAKRAGVESAVAIRRARLEGLHLDGQYGCIVTNPPYAERLGESKEVEELYRSLGRLFAALPTWSLFALTPHPGFEKLFGARATKNRKLYNGNIRCYFHQFFGPLPRRDDG